MGEEIIVDIEGFIRRLVAALNEGGFEYVLVGGVVAVEYGRPRSTQDCDIVLSIAEDELKKFCDCLGRAGFEVKEYDVREAFSDKTHFNAYYKGQYGFRADFSWKKGSLGENTFKRAQKKEIFGITATVESPEDLIIAKLVYGSPQDHEDAEAVLLRQRSLDMAYIEKRAREEGIQKQLNALLKKIRG
ncbi:MAG: DUF6036 family nucleotidyltransferase [Candidatus Micrarchaeota archaeon]